MTDLSHVKAFIKKSLEFGPKMPEFTGHIQAGVAEFAAAKQMAVEHFGAGHQLITITIEEACEQDAECKTLVERCEREIGLSADNKGKFMDFLTFVLQNPQLITLIMSFFKQTA